MRLPLEPRFSSTELINTLTRRWRDLADQVNGITEGRIEKHHTAYTAAPTTGNHFQGDEVKNSAPTELGGAGSKYVIVGWKCVTSGTPGTWVQMRTLTGN